MFANRKSTAYTEEFWSRLYDSQIFPSTESGKTHIENYWNIAYDSISKQDALFKKVVIETFVREMTSIRMELLGFAFSESSKITDHQILQSVFTQAFLKKINQEELWNIMGEYNQAIAQSATMDANGKQLDPTKINKARAEMFDQWCRENIPNPTRLTEQEKLTIKAVARVANRIGADIKKSDGILVKRIVVKFAERSVCDLNTNVQALSQIGAIVFGLYQGAREMIKTGV